MRVPIVASLALGAVMVVQSDLRNSASYGDAVPPVALVPVAGWSETRASGPHADPPEVRAEDLTAVVKQYCVLCHNDYLLTGNLSLQTFDVAQAPAQAETAEKMIKKLQAGMMPPPGMPRPAGDTLSALIETLQQTLDRAASKQPNPGSRSFQRLNRPDFEASIRDLLGLQIDAAEFLPPDTKSANFDNLADQQMLSPTLLDAYLRAATVVSRLAIGNPNASPAETQYRVDRHASQVDRIPGAPFGTRGGTSVIHIFPADGEYYFEVTFPMDEGGTVYGSGQSALHTAEAPEEMEFSIDGEPVARLEIDRWLHESDPAGATLTTEPIFIRSGQHRVTATFIKRFEGPLGDLIRPFDWSQTTSSGNRYGFLLVPHLRDLIVKGPYNPTGVSESLSRQKVFSCRPASSQEVLPCAEEILSRLAAEAFRRPVEAEEVEALITFYDLGVEAGGFEEGIRTGLEAILASPHFVFRFEPHPDDVASGESYPIGDYELASRLSFFLWATPPDEELLSVAREGRLSDRRVLAAQTQRMIADPRSEALATRFAAQWLRLPDLDEIHPDTPIYPDFHEQLKHAMRRETELFFYNLVQNDRNVLDLFTADYTFVNERLAKHYGINGIVGEEFQQVEYPEDSARRGLLGHGSILVQTSIPGRTSPVLRGKWVMEVILGTPPPPPPPGVPPLESTEESQGGRVLTTRERMEIHRANPTCNACHRFMDPIGLALDNFDVTGKWRIRENGVPLDTRGELYDGTPVSSPGELQAALLTYTPRILSGFTENLMTYALGRRVEYYDMPAVRRIVASAEEDDYRISSFVLGVVNSDAFRMRKAPQQLASPN